MKERARLVYSKTDERYSLETNMFSMQTTTSTPLNSKVMRSLIKLFSNEGKIDKALNNMDKQEASSQRLGT